MGQAERLALKRVFHSIRKMVLDKFDWLPHIKLEPCYVAEKDHERSARTYAHWGHRPGVICYAKDFENLPESNQRGITLHEFGHCLDDYMEEVLADCPELEGDIDNIDDDEVRADYIMVQVFDVPLSYDERDVQILLDRHPARRSARPARRAAN